MKKLPIYSYRETCKLFWKINIKFVSTKAHNCEYGNMIERGICMVKEIKRKKRDHWKEEFLLMTEWIQRKQSLPAENCYSSNSYIPSYHTLLFIHIIDVLTCFMHSGITEFMPAHLLTSWVF